MLEELSLLPLQELHQYLHQQLVEHLQCKQPQEMLQDQHLQHQLLLQMLMLAY